ncbi:hypothetical protein RPK52_24405, partial [Salmonella enterica]|uniref:hypothetical protein n=2 Tax=Enterobacterales TaxID=91347 RepID=UPI002AFF4D54
YYMLKKLITGKYSLPITFWAFGFGGYAIIGVIFLLAKIIFLPSPALFFARIIANLILVALVLSGIASILRRKFTILGVIAFLFFLTSFSINGYVIINLALSIP